MWTAHLRCIKNVCMPMHMPKDVKVKEGSETEEAI